MSWKKLRGIVMLLAVPAVVWAGNLVLPFTFSPGTPIRASEMNANFTALKGAVDDLDSRLSAAGVGVYKSGSRLKLMAIESNDGFAGPSASLTIISGTGELFWDDELKTACLRLDSSAYSSFRGRCVPPRLFGTGSAFTDSACQSRVATPAIDDAVFAPEGETPRSYGAYFYADGGVVLFENGEPSTTVQPIFVQNSNSSGLPDGGYQVVTTCDPGGTERTAPIIRTFDVSELAPLTLKVRR